MHCCCFAQDCATCINFTAKQLFGSDDSDIQNYFQQIKNRFIDVITKELGNAIKICNFPSKEDILSTPKFKPLNWDPITSFKKATIKPKLHTKTSSSSSPHLIIRRQFYKIEDHSIIF